MTPEPQNVEVDTSEEVDDKHIRLSDGRVIPKLKRVFALRKAGLEPKDPTKMKPLPVELDLKGTIYTRGKGNALVRQNGKPKLSKAEKKAMKKQASNHRKEVMNAVGMTRREMDTLRGKDNVHKDL